MLENIEKISLYTTAACNINCEHCIMRPVKKNCPNYEISLKELERFINITNQSGYKFSITISGGEPLLWTHLKQGLKMLRESPICKYMYMFTNAVNHQVLDEKTVSYLDHIRVSQYKENQQQINRLVYLYGKKIQIVNRTMFWHIPNTPLPNTTPADCEYKKWWYYNNQIYACAHCMPLCQKLKYNKIELSEPLKIDYTKKLYNIKSQLIINESGPCTICTTNGNFKKQAIQIINTKNASLKLL